MDSRFLATDWYIECPFPLSVRPTRAPGACHSYVELVVGKGRHVEHMLCQLIYSSG